MNCADVSLEAKAFDAKNGVRIYPSDRKQFYTEPGQSQQLHRAGQGKGYSQMILTIGETEGNGGTIGFHLNSGKWAVVTGFNYDTETFTVEQNLDSAPSSCQ